MPSFFSKVYNFFLSYQSSKTLKLNSWHHCFGSVFLFKKDYLVVIWRKNLWKCYNFKSSSPKTINSQLIWLLTKNMKNVKCSKFDSVFRSLQSPEWFHEKYAKFHKFFILSENFDENRYLVSYLWSWMTDGIFYSILYYSWD